VTGVLLEEAKNEVRALIAEATEQAGVIVREATEEKDAVLAAARQQAAAIAADAHRAGREKGEKEALEKIAAADKLLADAAEIRQEAYKQRDKLLSGAEGEIVQLVLAVAAKVIKAELATNRETVFSLVRGGIAELAGAKRITIRAHPALAGKLTGEEEALSRLAGSVTEVTISGEPSFEPGDCQIESDYGILDAGVDTQLNNLAHAMLPVTENDRL